MVATFTLQRTGIPVKSSCHKGEWSQLSVTSGFGQSQFDVIERRSGKPAPKDRFVFLGAGNYRVRPYLFQGLVQYTSKFYLRRHASNTIQPLIHYIDLDKPSRFDPNETEEGYAPDRRTLQGNILIHGVGGVGGLEGCLAPGKKDKDGSFGGSWEAMDVLMSIVEREPVILRVLNDPLLP